MIFTIAINLIMIFEFAQADSEGPNSPASATTETGFSEWSNPTNVYSSDNARASYNATHQMKLRAYNFSFDIPYATIDGFYVEVEGYATSSTFFNERIRVALSKSGYTVEGDSKYEDLPCCKVGDEDYITFGSSSDLWGGTWSESDVESSDFGVLVWDYDATASALYIDHIRVTVYYTLARDTIGRSEVGTIIANDNTENRIRGGYYTADGNGTGDSLYFYLRSSGSHTKNVKGALYDGWLNLIDTTSERSINLTSSYQWFGFALQNSPEIVDGKEYIFVVWAQSGTGYCYLAQLSATGEARQYRFLSYTAWPDPLGGYKYYNANYYCYMVYIVSEPPETAPTECKLTTWYSETFDPDGYGDCCPGAPCEEPRYVTYLHGENAGFSAVSRIDNVDSAWIQIGTTASDSNFWNSGAIEITQIDSADRCEKILLDSSKTIQDGIQYHWRTKFWNSSGWSDWSVDHIFEGVAPIEWWDTLYTHRRNIRADTSHDLLYAGYTIPFEMSTGYGVVLSDEGNVNSGIPNAPSMDYHDGYSYISYMGDSTSGQGILRVGKYNHGSGEWTQITVDTISGSGDQVNVHNYPVILVGDDEKIHLWRGGHASQGLYYRTDSTHAGNGINITDWSGPDTITALAACTYPIPAIDTSGNLYVFFRHYDHSYHDHAHYCYVKSTDNGANWGDRQHIIYYYDYEMDGSKAPSVYNGGVTIDDNNRCHILVSWWEAYGNENLGRAESYIFSDYDDTDNEFKYWRELETADTVGEISTSPDSTKNVSYETCSKVDTCNSPDTDPIVCPCPNTNCYGIATYKHPDSSYCLPYFTYFKFTNYKLEETPIYFAKWNGSAWDITNLNTGITPNGPKLWNAKTGAPLVIDGNTIYVYGFVKPSGEEYYGGELVRWRGTELGTNWTWDYFSLNSGKGIGQISVLPRVPSGQKREMVYCRAKDIVWMEDYHFPSMRNDGADIKIVQGYYNANTVSWTEVHRVPSNAFQLQTTEILFPLKSNIAANYKAPSNKFYQVYWGNNSADPDSIKDDPDSVFQYYESFEAYDTSSAVNGQGGWTTQEEADDSALVFTSYSGFQPDVWKVWSGDQYLYIKNDPKCRRYMGANVTDVEIHAHIFTEGVGGRVWMGLADGAKDIKLGLTLSQDSVYYDLNGNTDTTGPAIRQDQYYDLKICVDYDSGCAGYVNDVLVFDWADTIVQFDTLIIDGASVQAVVDGITMVKYVVSSPSPVLADGWQSIEAPRRRRILPAYRGIR